MPREGSDICNNINVILAVTRENHGCMLLCKIEYVYCCLALASTNK